MPSPFHSFEDSSSSVGAHPAFLQHSGGEGWGGRSSFTPPPRPHRRLQTSVLDYLPQQKKRKKTFTPLYTYQDSNDLDGYILPPRILFTPTSAFHVILFLLQFVSIKKSGLTVKCELCPQKRRFMIWDYQVL